MTDTELDHIFDMVVDQIARYSKERRASTQPFHLEAVESQFPDYSYDQMNDVVREPLIEHVGSLPIIATALHPYINDDSVDLGDALIMMAVHDIGELETGDESTFTKSDDDEDTEYKAALEILHPSLHSYYDRVEKQSDNSGKFAKSIDKIAPDFLDFMTPGEYTLSRFDTFADVNGADEIIDLVRQHKGPYFAWNPFLAELHEHLLARTLEKLKAAS